MLRKHSWVINKPIAMKEGLRNLRGRHACRLLAVWHALLLSRGSPVPSRSAAQCNSDLSQQRDLNGLTAIMLPAAQNGLESASANKEPMT